MSYVVTYFSAYSYCLEMRKHVLGAWKVSRSSSHQERFHPAVLGVIHMVPKNSLILEMTSGAGAHGP